MQIKSFLPIFIIILLSCLTPVKRHAKNIQNFREYIRAGRWGEAEKYFLKKTPIKSAEFFAYARAKEALKRPLFSVIGSYVQAIKKTGKHSKDSSIVKNQIASIQNNSVGLLYARLSIWRAANYLKRKGYSSLARTILRKVRLWPSDPLNSKIILLRSKLEKGVLTDRERIGLLKRLPNNMTAKIRQAAIWNKLETFSKSLHLYREIIRKSSINWVLKSVYYGLRKNPNKLHNLLSLQERMQLLPFLNNSEWKKLKSDSTNIQAKNCNTQFVKGCGLYLIKKSSPASLWKLTNNNQDYLTKHTSILSVWLSKLLKKNQLQVSQKIFLLFSKITSNEKSIWTQYIKYLQKRKNKWILAKELSASKQSFLGRTYHDILLKILLKYSSSNFSSFPSYAPERYWNKILTNLKPGALKARVLYWNYRRLLSKNKNKEAEKILKNFYIRTRGSFYSQAFWQISNKNNSNGNFKQNWYQVKSTNSFYKWLSLYGGRKQSLVFLKNKNISRFKQRSAWKLIRLLKTLRYHIPSETMELYRIGEYSLASRFSRQRVTANKTAMQRNLIRYYIGEKSSNRFMQIWYLRQIMQDKEIYIDPFTLPEHLLKILYPRPYYNKVISAANSNSRNPAEIYSIMRQESMFKEKAISRSNAQGLMQILPSTGKWLAKKKKVNLLHPHTSIKLGTKFLSDLINRYGGFYWANIAYNGGPGNLRKWKRRYYRNDYYAFLENIPSKESRHYARITAHNLMVYNIIKTLYGN